MPQSKLHPEPETKPAAQEAVQEAANAPITQAALRRPPKKLLQEDPVRSEAIARLRYEGRAAGVNITTAGSRSVASGGKVSGSVILTGDRNKVER